MTGHGDDEPSSSIEPESSEKAGKVSKLIGDESTSRPKEHILLVSMVCHRPRLDDIEAFPQGGEYPISFEHCLCLDRVQEFRRLEPTVPEH